MVNFDPQTPKQWFKMPFSQMAPQTPVNGESFSPAVTPCLESACHTDWVNYVTLQCLWKKRPIKSIYFSWPIFCSLGTMKVPLFLPPVATPRGRTALRHTLFGATSLFTSTMLPLTYRGRAFSISGTFLTNHGASARRDFDTPAARLLRHHCCMGRTAEAANRACDRSPAGGVGRPKDACGA